MPTALYSPSHRSLTRSLGGWVSCLVDRYPDFDEYDLAGMVEEKTGLPVGREDFETIRSLYLRAKLQAWRPETEEEEG